VLESKYLRSKSTCVDTIDSTRGRPGTAGDVNQIFLMVLCNAMQALLADATSAMSGGLCRRQWAARPADNEVSGSIT
jgi:hypothetical protein